MDILPHSLSLDRVLKSIQINYVTEAKLDDNVHFMVDMNAVKSLEEISCSTGDVCKRPVYVEGRKGAADGTVLFQAELEF